MKTLFKVRKSISRGWKKSPDGHKGDKHTNQKGKSHYFDIFFSVFAEISSTNSMTGLGSEYVIEAPSGSSSFLNYLQLFTGHIYLVDFFRVHDWCWCFIHIDSTTTMSAYGSPYRSKTTWIFSVFT